MEPKVCPVCGEPVWGLSVKRRAGLWLRNLLEGWAARVDRWTVEPFDAAKTHPLHLSDEEWEAWQDAIGGPR